MTKTAIRRASIIGHYAQSRSLQKTADEFGVTKQAVHQLVKRWAPEIMAEPHVSTERRELRVGQPAIINFPGYGGHGKRVQIREFWKLDLPQIGRKADMVTVRFEEGHEISLAPSQLIAA
jgi:hypothetical protein